MADNVIGTSYNNYYYLPVISVMLVDAKYLRVGNCLFLGVQFHWFKGDNVITRAVRRHELSSRLRSQILLYFFLVSRLVKR